MYTIGQVSSTFQIPISTLRYYDKEGLFPDMERSSGARRFSDKELEALHVIECLKKTGMEIKDIRQYMKWCGEGASTYPQRRQMFEIQKKNLEERIRMMGKSMAMIRFKCWYYEQLIEDGTEERVRQMLPDHLPEEIQQLYDFAHDLKA